MLFYLTGEDNFRLREREKELATDFLVHFPDTDRAVFRLDEDANDFSSRVRERLSGGLFAAPVLLHLREITFLPEGADRELQKILGTVAGVREQLVIVSDTGKTKKGTAFAKWLAKNATTETFPKFDEKNPEALAKYGTALLKKINPAASIEKEALLALAERAEGNMGRLFQELAKLSVYRAGAPIRLEDVELLSAEPVGSNAFLALDALVAGRRGQAIALFRREEKAAVPVQKTFGLCAWQLRRLIAVAELSAGGMRNAQAIARELKSSPYPIQKILPKLSQFPLSRLKRGMTLLSDLDVAIRSGRIEPGVAIDLFVWKF